VDLPILSVVSMAALYKMCSTRESCNLQLRASIASEVFYLQLTWFVYFSWLSELYDGRSHVSLSAYHIYSISNM